MGLDYERLLRDQDWFCLRNLPMIVSPDFDGLLCALIMAEHLDWQLRGFYDGKTLALDQPANHIGKFVFLDMEIYRPCKFDPTSGNDFAKAQDLWDFLRQVTGYQTPPLPKPNWTVNFDARTDTLSRQVYLNALNQNPLSFALL